MSTKPSRGNAWRVWEDDLLRSLYPETRNEQLARLVGRTEGAIKARANILGVRKSAAYMQRAREKTQFKKGVASWNKGLQHPATGRSAETQFKKGHRPANWLPIGSERETRDGYLQRKVTDTGVTRKDFVPVHHLVWVEHTGEPVPKGHALIFKDDNKRNFDINNLELLTRAELMERNSIQRLPPEVSEVTRFAEEDEYGYVSLVRNWDEDETDLYLDTCDLGSHEKPTYHYVWCCRAIIWAIQQYDAANTTEAAA